MKTLLLKERIQNSIEGRVARLLRELGNPDPPLRIEDVRFLLETNLGYFQRDDDGILQRLAHRLKVAGHQIADRPGLLLDVVKNLDLRALWIPDRKFILIDESQPKAKWRWLEAHEMGHKLCPWHGDFLFGDTDQSVSPACHEKLEAEANFAAGNLLFLGDRFRRDALDVAPGFASINSLKVLYNNTLTTTLWRYVEQLGKSTPMVGVISCHPHYYKRPDDYDPLRPCKYVIQSPVFTEQFSNITEIELFGKIVSYCGSQRGGPLGEDIVDLTDARGEINRFKFETFYNGHQALTLGWYIKKKPLIISGNS